MFFKKKKVKPEDRENEKEVNSFVDKIKSKLSKKNVEKEKKISFFKLLSFSDWIDRLIMIVGLAAALGAAVVYPFMFYLYGEVAKTLVNYGRDKNNSQNLNSSTNLVFNSTSGSINVIEDRCEVENKEQKDYDNKISEIVNYYVLLGFVTLFLEYLAHVTWNSASERQINKLRNKLYETIVRQDMSFFDQASSGELNSVLNSNIESIKVGISFKVSDFVCMLSRGIACTIMALVKAWKFTIVFFALIPFMILSTALMVVSVRKYTVAEFKAYGTAGGIAQEALSSIRTVLAFGLTKNSISNYAKNLDDAEKMAKKKGFVSGIFGGLSGGLLTFCFGVGIIYGVYLYRLDCIEYNPGAIIQSFFLVITSTFSIGQALPYLKELAEAKGSAIKVFEILETKSKIDAFDSNGQKLSQLNGEIEFKDVHFSYPTRPEAKILKGLSLRIPAGKTVALVGSSGGGKSTVISLLQKFYLPESGHISLDGHQINELNLCWFREQMALVSQEPILFTSTIKENIRLGRLDASDAEIEEAAKNANAHNFIMNTTKKYETLVGERGSQLSGGQKQRIAIARALIRNPKILLLDEATSALDYESERIVQEALDKAKIGRTTIIIAHRLSTIRNADIIAYISNGQLMEIGTHDQLIESKGFYYDLVQSQTQNPINKVVETGTKSKKIDSDLSSDFDSDDENEEMKRRKSLASIDDKKEGKKKKKFRPKKIFYYEKKLLKLQKPELIWIILGVLGSMCVGIVFPLTGLVFSNIYNVFQSPWDDQIKESLKYMGILFGIALANLIANLAYNYSISLAGARLTRRVRVHMFESMMRQEIGFHDLDENRSSILATQLSMTAPFCKGLSSDKLGILSQGIAGIGFSVVFGLVVNWKLALVMLIFVPITFTSGIIVGRSSTSNKVKGKSSNEEGGRITIETIENIKTVISLGREKHFITEFNGVFEKRIKKTLLMFHVTALFYGIMNSLLFFIQATGFSFGYYLIKNDGLKTADLYKIYASITFSSIILGRAFATLPDQKKSQSAAKTAFKIINRKSKIDALSEEGLKPSSIVGNIRFENVYFRYPTRPQIKILNGFNLEIKNGQTNALVGPSGCGKSTTISLLLRFYDVESGVVYLDDIDIRKLNINWLRSKIGLVSQEPTLFNTSILENIKMGDIERDSININEVISAATDANIHDKIQNLPEKYDTSVGSKGGQLSGGEKQRVAIARALIRNPRILLLDEATSALDNQSEHIVQDALDKAQVGRTCIVIAHRLSTIQNSNKISVVKDGIVLEEGTHSDLMQKKQFYFNLQNQTKKN
uniref:ATP-binding cassette transporter subfamily B member 1-like protein X2 n=1 Tax=Brachionus plicatilis TaxID=10195 RepID=A0A7H9SMX7_BRAPC|nr:ATP-binding cassette transporter subfamily B member 1-like protein X2 [Brachionus plicatilis]